MSKSPQKISDFFNDAPLTGLFSVSAFTTNNKGSFVIFEQCLSFTYRILLIEKRLPRILFYHKSIFLMKHLREVITSFHSWKNGCFWCITSQKGLSLDHLCTYVNTTRFTEIAKIWLWSQIMYFLKNFHFKGRNSQDRAHILKNMSKFTSSWDKWKSAAISKPTIFITEWSRSFLSYSSI